VEIKCIQQCEDVDDDFIEVSVPSRTDPGTHYSVLVVWEDDEYSAVCECEGYQFRGHCSHQQKAFDQVCSWVEGAEPQTEEQRRDKICPVCLGPTEWKMVEDE